MVNAEQEGLRSVVRRQQVKCALENAIECIYIVYLITISKISFSFCMGEKMDVVYCLVHPQQREKGKHIR